MRPVNKWSASYSYINEQGDRVTITATYEPHQEAGEPLVDNIGQYCSYCEVFSSDLQVEHVIPYQQINDPWQNTGSLTKFDWGNFLLGCARCNGRSCKTDTYVYLPRILLPHRNDTYHALEYKESGEVFVNLTLSAIDQRKATALIDLVQLNRAPYEKPRDYRTRYRRNVWTYAVKQKVKYENNPIPAMRDSLVEFALQRGFFSVWYTVFQDHPEVQEALRAAFPGTNESYF